MSLFPFPPSTPRTDDRGAPTPASFASFDDEWAALTGGAALVDLTHHGVVRVAGEERVTFLSGLVTNQVRRATPEQAVHAALLTPQGRFLWEFTILAHGESLLLLTGPDRVAELAQRLLFHKLRSRVSVVVESAGWGELAVAGPGAREAVATLFPQVALPVGNPGEAALLPGGIPLFADPRHGAFGWRLLAPAPLLPEIWQRLAGVAQPVGFLAWERHRLAFGLPRGGAELPVDQSLPLEAGFLELNGVDFQKGCYMGQETTARTRYRGTIRRRLYALTLPAEAEAAPGDLLLTAQGREAGVVTSVSQVGEPILGLGLIRVADLEEGPLFLRGVAVAAKKPDWATWE